MSNTILTTGGRVVMAEAIAALSFVAALSRGDPAWDGTWEGANPPAPGLDARDVLDLAVHVRPTIIDFVEPDEAGAILTDEGGRYALSPESTRYLRVRVSVPAGTFDNEEIREVGIFAKAEYAEGVPPGKTVLEAGDIVSPGTLMQAIWSRPQHFETGTSYARNFILRV
ncbi:hypothetical protein FP2506_11377 [Fulvimarina pelagi HTCC2506]|uniref:Uncharacterized protein n=1 Tax=Fulvimarina pelagi HTCC2506 TaxID=314231 RepID=Q0FZ04_9HYPH|nr:hypothetical protein [Fulvimarina pelagi]EAU40154.1 hypothetical protein FP2506_11377 [Fulvimarina pelagi HTCC2506]